MPRPLAGFYLACPGTSEIMSISTLNVQAAITQLCLTDSNPPFPPSHQLSPLSGFSIPSKCLPFFSSAHFPLLMLPFLGIQLWPVCLSDSIACLSPIFYTEQRVEKRNSTNETDRFVGWTKLPSSVLEEEPAMCFHRGILANIILIAPPPLPLSASREEMGHTPSSASLG